jgi:hypothetical protein
LAGETTPAGKRVLLCLLDVEQRPSRRVARLLAERHEGLRTRGLTVLAVHVGPTNPDAFKEWREANPMPFPVGRVPGESEKTRWAAGTGTLPWLILTDAAGRVIAEGFALEELEAKLEPAAPVQ